MYDLKKILSANNLKLALLALLLLGATPAFAQWANGEQGYAPDQQPSPAPQPTAATKPAPAKATTTATTAPTTTATTAPAGLAHPWDDKSKQPKVSEQQDKAVKMAREGSYDEPLRVLSGLHQKDTNNQSVSRDYATVLAWSGKDQEAVTVYESLPAQQPDYVLAAIGKSYRNLNQLDKSLAVYQQGETLYPDNVTFVEGQVRVLSDQGKFDEALAKADADMHKHGDRPEIVAARKDVAALILKSEHDKAVELARQHNYKQSIPILESLHKAHPEDVTITQDYLAVLDWSGGHNREVVNLYKTLPEGKQPDYVYEAVGHAYRNMHQYKEANAIYTDGLRNYPDSEELANGRIRTLMDAGRTKEAQTAINDDIKSHGRRPLILAADRDLHKKHRAAAGGGGGGGSPERRHAVMMARKGQYDQAITSLKRQQARNPRDVGIRRDLAAVYGWSGNDQECVATYETLGGNNQPNYVIDAAALCYRHLHQPEKALALYQQGLRRSPKNESFMAGAIHSLADEGYVEKALALANEDIRRHGERLNVLLAAGDAADQYNQYDAMKYYQAAMKIAPNNRYAVEGVVRNADRMGQPELAIKTAREHPNVISADSLRRIQNDEAGMMVRYGMVDQGNGEDHNAATDRAIARLDSLISEWQNEPAAKQNLLQARYDRVIAYHNRNRMQDAVQEYNSLKSAGAPVPVYVMGAAGDAYLDMRQPEKAKELYLKVLDTEPNNLGIRRQLFYAYVDCDDFTNAYKTIDSVVAAQPEGTSRAQSQILAGEARLWAGDTVHAKELIVPAAAQVSTTPFAHEALGNLYNAQGLPRKALAEFQSGDAAAGGKDLGNKVGIATTELALRRYQAATDDINTLVQQYPDNANVKRAARALEVHNMNEVRITAGYDFQPDTSANVIGGEGYGIGAQIFSKPLYKYWRIFAGEFYTNQREPNAEGHIGFSRTNAGVEYRKDGLVASIAPTYNKYNGTERVGVAGEASYDINDNWTIAGSGERFSRDTPLRAMNQGITSDYVGGHAIWQQDDTRSARFGGGIQPFSDGNFRTAFDANFTQRLFTRQELRVDGLLDGAESNNSGDQNRSYYNPKHDFIGLVGARAIHTIYQRYSTLWQQALTLQPGAYWEDHYGTDAAFRARYEQRVFLNDTFEAGAGLNYRRQSYDGNPENDFSLTLDVLERF